MTTVEIPVPPIGRPTGWWGMLVVVAAEATLFAILLASYFYTRFRTTGAWPPDGQPDPRLLKPVIMTLLLMASSVTVYTAELGSRRGDLRRLHAGLAATFVLGLSFLLTISCLGICFLPLLWAVSLILSLVGALQAAQGKRYRYPLIIRVLHA